jgi:hypothetical protein
MTKPGSNSKPSELPQWLRVPVAVCCVVLLFSVCSVVPFLLAKSFGVWIGLMAAVVAIVCWVYLVRPMPGFTAGIIAFFGLAVLAGLLIVWLIRVIR